MKRSVGLWALVGFAATSLLGTLLHFLYDWLGESALIAPFSGVNESTWEHMKLLFWPMLLFGILQSFFFRSYESFWCVQQSGILIGLFLIPILFYTYNGAIGKSPDFVNIAIFFLSAAVAYIYEAKKLKSGTAACEHPKRSIGVLLFLALLFVLFTYFPPRIGLFKDPLTGTYGI